MKMMDAKLDLGFKVTGTELPVDHGFALYGALSRVLPFFHEEGDLGLKFIRGRYVGGGMLDISPRSELVLRVPAYRIGAFLDLAGKSLDVQGHSLSVGAPITRCLVPAAVLHSPLVTTRNGHDRVRFEAELNHQMEQMGVRGKLSIARRRTFTIHGKQVVGYEALISELTAEESISVQCQGLGGRRKMGCGFFEVLKG
jgi:CRISPR-associated protein Cas6